MNAILDKLIRDLQISGNYTTPSLERFAEAYAKQQGEKDEAVGTITLDKRNMELNVKFKQQGEVTHSICSAHQIPDEDCELCNTEIEAFVDNWIEKRSKQGEVPTDWDAKEYFDSFNPMERHERFGSTSLGINWHRFAEAYHQYKSAEQQKRIEGYAEFCVQCDRSGLKLVSFKDYLEHLLKDH